MKKTICVERRTENSPRAHFNHVGDWRPRLIIWPEYDGLTPGLFEERTGGALGNEIEAAWGQIIAQTIARFCARDHVRAWAFTRGAGAARPGWRRLWEVAGRGRQWEMSAVA